VSTSTSSMYQGGGGGRGDGDVKEVADNKQQLSPASTTFVDDHERKEMEKDRLNEHLALSNDIVVSDKHTKH